MTVLLESLFLVRIWKNMLKWRTHGAQCFALVLNYLFGILEPKFAMIALNSSIEHFLVDFDGETRVLNLISNFFLTNLKDFKAKYNVAQNAFCWGIQGILEEQTHLYDVIQLFNVIMAKFGSKIPKNVVWKKCKPLCSMSVPFQLVFQILPQNKLSKQIKKRHKNR